MLHMVGICNPACVPPSLPLAHQTKAVTMVLVVLSELQELESMKKQTKKASSRLKVPQLL